MIDSKLQVNYEYLEPLSNLQFFLNEFWPKVVPEFVLSIVVLFINTPEFTFFFKGFGTEDADEMLSFNFLL